MTPTTKASAVVIDANVLLAICAREKDKYQTAKDAIEDYAANGWTFYAPSVIVAEVLYVLCNKHQNHLLTDTEYQEAIEGFREQMSAILSAPDGEASLIVRAVEIRSSYGCSRSSDSIYIALAEELERTFAVEFLTFDKALTNQVTKNAPSVRVNVLPS